jgi:hypothetical protein
MLNWAAMSHAAPVDRRLARMTLEQWAAPPEDEASEIVDCYLRVDALWAEIDALPDEGA